MYIEPEVKILSALAVAAGASSTKEPTEPKPDIPAMIGPCL